MSEMMCSSEDGIVDALSLRAGRPQCLSILLTKILYRRIFLSLIVVSAATIEAEARNASRRPGPR
jgi:hypothetical protein